MFNLKAGNGEIILTSETYKAKDATENGLGVTGAPGRTAPLVAALPLRAADDRRPEWT